ncbi:growth/differentiation factor 10b [Echeneis naucrates]|uniref:Fibronectin type-III domain-containing protein n=1 Tax=Echeneis naucrates TaxID=173247 RepID=A0A665W8C9_ECHNA|nr:interferon gamma receptor 1 [Echeneis naucrates]
MARSRSPLLLLCCLAVISAHVEPPTNVSLQCHNLHNILKWDYGILLPGIKFKVNIRPYDSEHQVLWVEPPTLQADLSFLSDPFSSYLIDVAAVVGENESITAPTDGISFSYFQDMQTIQKCSLDLPPVNVTNKPNDEILLSFIHPLRYHKQGRNLSDSQKKTCLGIRSQHCFNYEIVVNNQNEHHAWCSEDICEKTLPVNPSWNKHCVNITGEVDLMAVKSTQLYCSMPAEEIPPMPNSYIYIIIGVLSCVTFVIVAIFFYKEMTRPSTKFPLSLVIGTKSRNRAETFQDQFTVAAVEPSSPTPLLPQSSEESESSSAGTSLAEPDFHLSIVVSDREQDESIVVDEGHENDGHGYMEGNNLEEDEEDETENPSSGYEKRNA